MFVHLLRRYGSVFGSLECVDDVTAFDLTDGNVTSDVSCSGVVNTVVPGNYTVTLSAIDSDLHFVSETRQIAVLANPVDLHPHAPDNCSCGVADDTSGVNATLSVAGLDAADFNVRFVHRIFSRAVARTFALDNTTRYISDVDVLRLDTSPGVQLQRFRLRVVVATRTCGAEGAAAVLAAQLRALETELARVNAVTFGRVSLQLVDAVPVDCGRVTPAPTNEAGQAAPDAAAAAASGDDGGGGTSAAVLAVAIVIPLILLMIVVAVRCANSLLGEQTGWRWRRWV